MTSAERVAGVVRGVVRQALADAGARWLVLLDDGSPEATLAGDWCTAELGANFVARARGERLLPALGEPGVTAGGAPVDDAVLAEEARRAEARLLVHAREGAALVANPANKTALLLSRQAPPEPLLPVGDLYATDVLALAGGCSLPPALLALARQVGGIEALDGALRAHFDERRPLAEALGLLREEARRPVARAIEAARFGRQRPGLVPKLGPRTLGLDLFD